MMKALRKLFITVIALIATLYAVIPVCADSMSYEDPASGYRAVIEDDAGLIEEPTAVLESMKPITEYGNVMLKTVDENNYTAKDLAEKYLHSTFGKASATIFLIDMDNRKLFIYSDGAIYRTITNSKAEVITDNIYRYASNEDYDSCAIKCFTQMETLLEGGKIAEPMHIIGIALIALLLGMIICFVIMWNGTKKKPVTSAELIKGTDTSIRITEPISKFVSTSRVYSPPSSSDGGGSSSGGGYSGGSGGSSGGGGGGSSGGGGGHSF